MVGQDGRLARRKLNNSRMYAEPMYLLKNNTYESNESQ